MGETQVTESGSCWNCDDQTKGGSSSKPLYFWMCLKRSIGMTNKMEIRCEPARDRRLLN